MKYVHAGFDIERGVTLSSLLEPKEVKWTLGSRLKLISASRKHSHLNESLFANCIAVYMKTNGLK